MQYEIALVTPDTTIETTTTDNPDVATLVAHHMMASPCFVGNLVVKIEALCGNMRKMLCAAKPGDPPESVDVTRASFALA